MSNTTYKLDIPEDELKRISSGYKTVSLNGEVFSQSYITQQAKKLGVDKADLYSLIKRRGVDLISSKEKVLHFHRTSLKSAESILSLGHLYNRENLKNKGYDISHLSGSSSKNVQFTVDSYDKQGNLSSDGFDVKHSVGASSSDVVFVMGPELLNEETYDCFQPYPTVEKASIRDCCVALLAKDPETLKKLQDLLAQNKIDKPVFLQSSFDRDDILQELSASKEEIEPESGRISAASEKETESEPGRLPASCEEAYSSIDISKLDDKEYTSNQSLSTLLMAANYKQAPFQDQVKLKQCVSNLIKSGVNIYSAQADIMRAIRENPASVFAGNGTIKRDTSNIKDQDQAQRASDQLNDLARTDTYISQIIDESPYEKIFSQLQKIEEIIGLQNKRENSGDFSQSDYYNERISQIRSSVDLLSASYQPQTLLDVANARSAVERENLFIEKGIKEHDGPVIMPTNNNTKSIIALKTIANKRSVNQGQERNL